MWDENGSLFVTGAHHDGRACVEMRQLTDKGEELYSCHQVDDGFHLPEAGFETMGFVYREGDENAFIHDLWDNPEMCSRPRFAEKALDMPAEEYIMVHDGVKTEFQITEVKEDSFAYDQGARFDVKVPPMGMSAATDTSAPTSMMRTGFASGSPTGLSGSVRAWTICARIAARSPLWHRMSMRKTTV